MAGAGRAWGRRPDDARGGGRALRVDRAAHALLQQQTRTGPVRARDRDGADGRTAPAAGGRTGAGGVAGRAGERAAADAGERRDEPRVGELLGRGTGRRRTAGGTAGAVRVVARAAAGVR